MIPRLSDVKIDGDKIPVWKAVPYDLRSVIIRFAIMFQLLITVLVVLFPLYWTVITAIRPPREIYQSSTTLIPSSITLDAFETVIFATNFPTWYLNSIIVSLGVVLLTTVTSTLAGYGLTRIDFKYKQTFARTILFGYMFPSILLAIPMYIYWRMLGMIDSIFGVAIAITALSLPFSIWIMWKFFQTVPISLEESAQINGATRFRAFYEIALPMAKPGIVAVGIFAFASAWGHFTMAEVLLVSNENWVTLIGLLSFRDADMIHWEQLLAGSILTMIPPYIFLVSLQKYLLQGFRSGGIG